MIHFDAKHQKSEAKTKVKYRKLSEKIEVKQKLSEKSKKNEKKLVEFRFALFRFEAKLLNPSEAKI
jgi:hypothetical protein